MAISLVRVLITAGLTVGLLRPVLAQTARIAHLSHSGSAAKLDEADSEDNFGGPIQPPYFKADSIRLISDTTAMGYGRWHKIDNKETTLQIRLAARIEKKPVRLTKQQLVREYQHYQPEVKLIGFDSTAKPAASAPTLKKQNTKRKKSVFAPTISAPAQHPGVALAVALILTLTGAGWLLGERRLAQPKAA
ncbi:hypothetical protein [Hymenobacter ruricola]|uniref:Uncharacterized protein n=1 Tax=Hymenobacter ruricola TaxID=2791023 RepID=A0ABS0IBK0_9BACT|nr:hypothetical protein [Hymenobacter ruricola]MBF9224335.1 hypothetical protein [Hymenobacter ruricola]